MFPSATVPGSADAVAAFDKGLFDPLPGNLRFSYLIASGLIGDPTAPVIGSGAAEKRNE